MMCELFCGKVNYDVYKKEKEHDGKYAEDISPYKVQHFFDSSSQRQYM